ncbi:hypothetical protein SANTM175S_03148 [Streptomyces antimycoticus]
MTATTAVSAPGAGAATTGAPPVVRFEQVNKSYGSVRAVADLDLTLYPGETVALLGPNGAGKSSSSICCSACATPTPGGWRSSAPPRARPSSAAGSARCCRAAL